MTTSNLLGHKLNYVKTFIASVTSIFSSEMGVTLKKRSATVRNSSKPAFQVVTIVGFVADTFKGQVVYSMSREFSEHIAKAMLPGKLPVEQKKMLTSCVGELGNMISGKASIDLAGANSIVEITPPTVVVGEISKIDFYEVPTISLVMDSTVGALEVNLAFQEK